MKATLYSCDAPGCGTQRYGTAVEPVYGLRGTVQQNHGGLMIPSTKWYACEEHHVLAAIEAVLRGEHLEEI